MKKTILATFLIISSSPVAAEYKIIFGNSNFDLPEPPTSEQPEVQSALSFDGTDDYVALSSSISLSTFTLEFWTKKTNTDDNMPFGTYDTKTDFFRTGYQDGFEISIGNDTQRIGWPDTMSPNNILNNFRHIAVKKEGTELEFFIDGISQGTVTINSNYSFTFEDIGTGWSIGNYFYQGILSDVRIWNTARTQTEIQNNMNKELTGSETGLSAYYKLDSGSGSTVVDSAGNNDGTINGATWVEK